MERKPSKQVLNKTLQQRLKLLQKINAKVSSVSKQHDQVAIQQQLKEMFDQIIQSGDEFQNQLLKKDFKLVILNLLHIEIQKNISNIHKKTNHALKDSFKHYRSFYQIQLLIYNQQEGNIYTYILKVLQDTKTLWYWPCANGDSLISYLRNDCLANKYKMLELIELLNKHPPSPKERIYNIKNRQFLHEAMSQIPEDNQKGTYVNFLIQLAKKQKVNLEETLQNSSNYLSMLYDLNVPRSKLQVLQSSIESNKNVFYILDVRQKKKVRIYLSPQHVNQLLYQIKDNRKYQHKDIDNHEYNLYCQISNQRMFATYRNVSSRLDHQSLKGYLMFGNLAQLAQRFKDGSWGLISFQGEKMEITEEQSKSIGQEILRSIKKEQQARFQIKIRSLEEKVEINTQSLKVSLYSKSFSNVSRVKQQYGYLIFIPSYKKNSKEQQMQDDQQLMENPITYTDVMQWAKPKQSNRMEQDEQIQEKVQNQVKVYKYLGLFKEYFEPLSDFTITKERHVQAHKLQAIQYFDQWQDKEFYQLINRHLLQENISIPSDISKIFKFSKKVQPYLAQKLSQIHKKTFVKLKYNYKSAGEVLILDNMRPTKEAYSFFSCLFQYFTCLYNEENSKKSFILQANKQELSYIKQRQKLSQKPEIMIVSQVKNKVQVYCTREEKQKMLNQLKALDEVHEFVFENKEAFELMKESQKQFLQQIQAKQLQKLENTFKISYKLKFHPQFKEKFRFACEMQQSLPGIRLQMKVANNAQFLSLYRSKLTSLDPQISVIKMGEDLLIEYDSKIEKIVMKMLQEISKEKEKEIFAFLKRSSKEYQFKNIEPHFVYSLKEKVQSILNETAKYGYKAVLKVDFLQKGVYAFQAVQTTEDQEKILEKQMVLFEKRFKQFKKCKSQIYDTLSYFNKAFSRIPSHEKYNKPIKAMNFQLKTKLNEQLTEIINKITADSYEKLQKEFIDYLKNSKLDADFQPKCVKQNETRLTTQTEGVKIFSKFLISKVEEAQKQSSVKNASLKQTILNQLQPIKNELEQRYSRGKLLPSNVKRLCKSLNILLTVYYGQQLPITPYLQDFRKKLEENDVVMVKVGTGSGKSTVIPPYLTGIGYKKVVVTQPRKLPCKQIYLRITEVFGQGVAGYAHADKSKDTQNSLIYMTDGLVKMQAIYKEEVFDSMDVLVIDEIHQRSANIDILLLLLTDYYRKLKRKLKLILCSATIDEAIGKMFTELNLKVASFEVKTERHQVQEIAIKEGTIIQKILQLSKKLQSNEQMLVFIPGEAEVQMTVKILEEKFNKLAHALTARVPQKQQESMLKNGQIFISTSIAETSLTFKNLKYVIDSRLSRWRKFNPELQLMETEESYSSNSSIKQRKGRLGRTCPGQYYYLEYYDNDFKFNKEHNLTQLQRVDLTQYVFELLYRNDKTFHQIFLLLEKLKHKPNQFKEKMNYSKKILEDSNILKGDGSLKNNAHRLLTFGNLSNPQHNVALSTASQQNCLMNMIYLVAFQMYGSVVGTSMLSYCKNLYKDGGDIRSIHDFLGAVGKKIDITNAKQSQIHDDLKLKCKQLADKPWFNVLGKIMGKAKQLMATNGSNVLASASQWNKIMRIMVLTYKNKVFFNQSLFGGNKKLYQKIKTQLIVNYQEEKSNPTQSINYILNFASSYDKDKLPQAILSLNCDINAMSECVLSMCESLNVEDIRLEINYSIVGADCKKELFSNSEPLNEKQAFDQIQSVVRNKSNNIHITYNFPKLNFQGHFADLAKRVKEIVEPKRRNKELKLNLKAFLQKAIKEKKSNWNKMASVIDPEHTLSLLQKLNFKDYQRLFDAMKYEMKNKYDVGIQWDVKQKTLVVKNAKNIHLNRIASKLTGFFNWFSVCQIITREQFKIKPYYIGDYHNYSKQMKQKVLEVMNRVNQIVDSKLQHYVLKGWACGRGSHTQLLRTARMIAVCWVLVNVFNCTIKGGFVRDWVVNKDQWLPASAQQRQKLLQKNVRNNYKEVVNPKVTPNDIDAQLPESIDFDVQKFKREMKKIGIVVTIEEDGWRKHVIFDQNSESGGFTADLIEPYTSLTQYTYDYDVNVMYIKKDYLNAIGMKIPLVYQNSFNHTIKKVETNELIQLCMNKKMTALKTDIPEYRNQKFKAKGWSIINKELNQPICYKSQFTQNFIQPLQNLQKISPLFYKMVHEQGFTVIKIEQLVNKGWDDVFEACENWIINELERSERKANPDNYDLKKINSNNKVLFHGCKSKEGAKGIKEFGFDTRYFNDSGLYGKGAYFADDPKKSHNYTSLPQRYMFLVNVALGKQQELTEHAQKKLGPGKEYHSIFGKKPPHNEYIVDRWGQAKPLYLITYK